MTTRFTAIGNFEIHSYAHHWQGIKCGAFALDGIDDYQFLDYRQQGDEEIRAGLEYFRPHVVLFCIQDALTDEILDLVKTWGAFTALWFCDLRLPAKRDLAGRLDLLLMTNHGFRGRYMDAWGLSGDQVRWLPQGCLKRDEPPPPDPKYPASIVHVGSWAHPAFHRSRRDLFREVRRRFRSDFWCLNPTSDAEKTGVTAQLAQIYPSASICIGESVPVVGYHSNRLFLVTGHAGFCFCNHFPGAEKLFAPGAEIETFDPKAPIEEVLDRMEWIHGTADGKIYRDRVRLAGFAAAQARHTYHHRMEELWGMITRRM